MRNKNLKRFLTTASALGMIAMGAQNASAAAAGAIYINNNATAALAANKYIQATGNIVAGALVASTAYDLVYTPANASTFDLNVANLTIKSINTGPAGTTPGLMTIDATGSAIGSVVLGAGGNTVAMTFNGAHTLTLNGTASTAAAAGAGAAGTITAPAFVAAGANIYTGLGAVDFADNAGTIVVSATGATFSNAFLSTGGQNGTMTITGASNIFTSTIGAANATGFAALNVNNDTTFKGATLRSTAITLADDKTMTVDSTTAAITVIGATDGAGAGNGTLVLQGTHAITHTGAVGANNALEGLTINTTGAGVLGNTTITGNTVVSGDISVTNTNASTATFTGTVTTVAGSGGSVDASGALGAVTMTGAVAIDGTITTGAATFTAGAAVTATNSGEEDAAITIGAGGTAITGATTATRGDIIVNNTGANAAAFGAAVTTTAGHSGNFDASASTGAVTITGAGNIDGTVSSGTGLFTNTAALNITNRANADTALTVGAGGGAGNGLVTVTRGDVEFSVAAGAAASTYAAGMTVTNGDVTTGVGAVNFTAASALTLTAADSKVVVGSGGVNSARAITFTNGGQVDLAGNLLQLSTANAIITGDVVSSAANGRLSLGYAGNTAAAGMAITGNIGTAASPIAAINVTGGAGGAGNAAATIGGAGSTVTNVYATATTINTADALAVNATAHSIGYHGTINGATGGLLITAGGTANTVTFNDAIGGTAQLAQITATAAGAAVVFKEDVSSAAIAINNASGTTFEKGVTGAVAIAATGAGTFLGSVNGAITSGGAGSAATFGNGAAFSPTVSGGLGAAGNAVTTITSNLGGGKLTVSNGAYTATNTVFNSDDTIALGAPTTASNFGTVTTATANTGTIDLSAMAVGHTLTAAIGTSAKPLKEVKLASGQAFSAGTLSVFAPITGAASNITITGAAGQTLLDIGTSTTNVPLVTFTGTGAATVGNVYADDITITANTLTAKSFHTKNGTALTAAGSTATILDGGSIDTVTGAGIVNTSGSATLGNIGTSAAHIAALNINGVSKDKVVTAGGNIYTSAMTQNGSTLKLNQDTVIDTGAASYTVAAASALDMNGKKLTINGAAPAINAPLAITYSYTSGDKNIITTANAPTFTTNVGVISVAFAGGTTPADGTKLNPFGTSAGAAYPAMTNAANTSVIFIADPLGRGFIDGMTFVAATGVATVSAPVTAAKFVGSNGGDNEKAVANALIAATSDEALAVFNNLKAMTAAERIEATKNIADHSSDANATKVADQAGAIASQAASSAASYAATTRMASTADGVAAGDASEKFGVWAQLIGGKGSQKERKGNAGFTARTFGGVFGADTMISENATIGMLVADVQNTVKSTDAKTGDKSKANSWLFGLYGSTDIASTDFFVQGNLTVAQTSVDAKDKKLVTTGAAKETARSKYDMMGIGAELVGGYKFKFDNSYVAPTAGLRYNYFGDTSYTQSGLSTGNQVVKTKATSLISGLVGIKFGAAVDMDGITINPEVHGNMSYAFNSPSSKTNFKINGMANSLNYAGPKASKFGANFGASVMADAYGFEYGVGYDANIADKYLAHQGSLKVKVKF